MTNGDLTRAKNSSGLNDGQVLDEKIKQLQEETVFDTGTQLKIRNLLKFFIKFNNK